MIVQLQNVVVVEFVHDFYFKFDLLDQIMLQYLFLVYDFNCKHIFADFVTHFVHFAKTTYANIRVSQWLEIVLPALSFFAINDRGRQEQDPVLDSVDLVRKMLRNLNRNYWCLFFLLFWHLILITLKL